MYTKITIENFTPYDPKEDKLYQMQKQLCESAVMPREYEKSNEPLNLDTASSIIAMKVLKRTYRDTGAMWAEHFYPSSKNPIFEDLKESAVVGLLEAEKQGFTLEDGKMWKMGFSCVNRHIDNERGRGMKGDDHEKFKLGFINIDEKGNEMIHDTYYELMHSDLMTACKEVMTRRQFKLFKGYVFGASDETIKKTIKNRKGEPISRAQYFRIKKEALTIARELADK